MTNASKGICHSQNVGILLQNVRLAIFIMMVLELKKIYQKHCIGHNAQRSTEIEMGSSIWHGFMKKQ